MVLRRTHSLALTPLNMMMKTVGAFILVGGVTAGLVGGSHLMQAAMAQGADPYRTLDTLAQALHHIEDQYIEAHPTGLLVEGAITGMTNKLDAHSTYLDPEELKAAQVRTEGVYSGVGLGAQDDRRRHHVVAWSPAHPLMVESRAVPGSSPWMVSVLNA